MPLRALPLVAATVAFTWFGTAARAVEASPVLNRWSDVAPTDWAYQALSNLVEQTDCLAGASGAVFAGRRAISRDEAAALLKACLERVTVQTDALTRLLQHFEPELAELKGRSDGLDARVAELEATQFSTTTTLSGLLTTVLGANRFMGSAAGLRSSSNRDAGGTALAGDLQLTLETSFTGKDQLTTVLRAGNFDGDDNAFASGGPSGLAVLETAFQEGDTPYQVVVDKLFYALPLGDSLTFTAGPVVGQEDMLAVWPSAGPSEPILDLLTLHGAPAAYNKTKGAGAGLQWSASNGFRAALSYVAANGASSDSGSGGIGSANAGSAATLQIGWVQERWRLAAVYSKLQNGQGLIAFATPFTQDQLSTRGVTHAAGLSGSWQPEQSGWIPSISAGWGINSSNTNRAGAVATSQSWSVSFGWSDVLLAGNAAGMAVGQPVFATEQRGSATPADGQFIWEWWYRAQLTDSMSLTPAVFVLSRPMGQQTPSGTSFSQLGGLIKTTLEF